MSTMQPDPELVKRMLNETDDIYDGFGGVDAEVATQLLYLAQAVLNTGWCDFGPPLTPEQRTSFDLEESTMLATHAVLRSLPCFPLLAPYFEPRVWTREEIEQLRTTHAVTEKLEGG